MTQHRVPNQSHDRIAPIRRDAALSRLSRTTRTAGVAVAVTAGLLAFYLGRELPGHHAGSTNTSGASTATTAPPAASGATPSTTGSGSGTAAPVTQAPAQATAPPVATSGAS